MTTPQPRPGTLVLVATPIGNLGDLSPRSARALADADVIACEDTRRTRQLLTHEGIAAGGRLVTVNDHTEAAQVPGLLARLDGGELVVLVSDAGMPAISDPGERLVAAAAVAGYRVEVVPGPSAALAALVVSGLPTGRFCFEGFLPRKGRARSERLAGLRTERRTTVVFEAPHRVRQTIADLVEAVDPLRRVVIVRELTKAYEEVWRGTLADAVDHLDATEPRGEYVLVLDGAAAPPAAGGADVDEALRVRLDAGIDKKMAITEVAAELGVPKRQVYDAATHL
ncbi:MAG: 16S rRNA (cytidine(1402)-2'-O)-methyltransferase [Actinomycetota bacterium]|nr:16S rRNA (cytidine(1402)-2'-O)-methyltransferase [Actinomycetota bacterium]